MNSYQSRASNQIIQELNLCTQLQYNGKLDIKNYQGKNWSFYYQIGQIVWATGGTHTYRRWLRNIAQSCPDLHINKIQYSQEDILIDYWDYLLLENLYVNEKIKSEKINRIIENTIAEVLFDLAQQTNLSSSSSSSLRFQRNQELVLKSPLISTNGSMFLKQMQELWCNWSEAGLADISPYLSPVLQKPEQLQRQVSSLVYKNFERLINGKYTLWDLAIKMNQNVLSITRSLLPYIQQEIVTLTEVADLPLPKYKVKKNSPLTQGNKEDCPLIACVDDSIQVCKMLEQIITSHGIKFIGINNPLQVLSTLIEKKPDLIFLDLMMPVVNGYQVCEQLRRISDFANIPIIILTSSDGVFDRARSKVYGATDFITKPVETNKIIEIVDNYLEIVSTVGNRYNLAFSA
ncbi:MAG: response regulator [Nostocales cyanobacterium]|nr:MAG: response regulator [Nostocales cyanobacterium]